MARIKFDDPYFNSDFDSVLPEPSFSVPNPRDTLPTAPSGSMTIPNPRTQLPRAPQRSITIPNPLTTLPRTPAPPRPKPLPRAEFPTPTGPDPRSVARSDAEFEDLLRQRPMITLGNMIAAPSGADPYGGQNPITYGEPDPNANRPPQTQGRPAGPRYQGGGINLDKWNDPAHQSEKYRVLRLLDQLEPAIARAQLRTGSGAIVDQLRALGFSIVDDDEIYRNDLGTIDVIHGDNREYGWNTQGGPDGMTNGVPYGQKPKKLTPPPGGTFDGDMIDRTPRSPVNLQDGGFTDPSTQTYQAILMRRLRDLLDAIERPDNDRYRDAALARAEELNQAPYTSAEEQALITRMRDPLTQARDTRRSEAIERMGARNLLPSSGLYQDQVFNEVDRDYERALASGTNDLAVRAVDERQRRRTASLDTLAQLVGLGSDERREDEGRERELVTTGAILPELTERRLRLLMDSINGTNSSVGSLTDSLMSLWNNQQNQANFQAGQSQMNAQQWGELIARLLASPLLNRGAGA